MGSFPHGEDILAHQFESFRCCLLLLDVVEEVQGKNLTFPWEPNFGQKLDGLAKKPTLGLGAGSTSHFLKMKQKAIKWSDP